MAEPATIRPSDVEEAGYRLPLSFDAYRDAIRDADGTVVDWLRVLSLKRAG